MMRNVKEVQKAFAYITNGARLLVFEHADFPDAGLQVPAGTIQPGEIPEAAALREATEETGLLRFSNVRFLATTHFDARPAGKDERHVRHFFQLETLSPVPEAWRHHERHGNDALTAAIAFDLYWLSWSEAARRLAHGHGEFVQCLR